jgi:hypothetical protein
MKYSNDDDDNNNNKSVIIGVNGTKSKSFRKYLNSIPREHHI